jgi:hypothetical protein
MSKREEEHFVSVIPGEKFEFKTEYKCPFCTKVFPSHYLRENHINLLHPMERKQIPLKVDEL